MAPNQRVRIPNTPPRSALIHCVVSLHLRSFPPVALSDIHQNPYRLSDLSVSQLWHCQTLNCQSTLICQTFTRRPVAICQTFPNLPGWRRRDRKNGSHGLGQPRSESNRPAARPPGLRPGGRCKTALPIVDAAAATPRPAEERAPDYP